MLYLVDRFADLARRYSSNLARSIILAMRADCNSMGSLNRAKKHMPLLTRAAPSAHSFADYANECGENQNRSSSLVRAIPEAESVKKILLTCEIDVTARLIGGTVSEKSVEKFKLVKLDEPVEAHDANDAIPME